MKQGVGYQGQQVGYRDAGVEIEVPAPPLQPVRLPSYTVSRLPPAAQYPQCIVYVSNGNRNRRLAISDGVNWRFADGTIVYI